MKHVIKSNTNSDNVVENLDIIIKNLQECKQCINAMYYEEVSNSDSKKIDEIWDAVDLGIVKSKELKTSLTY